jgi:hypothetical protein
MPDAYRLADQSTNPQYRFPFTGVGKKAVISDLHEPEGQNMEQETTNQFLCIQRHRCVFLTVLPIFIDECHFPVLYRCDPVVAYGNPMGVAAKVLEHLLRSGKRLFCINNPGLFPGQVYQFVTLFRQPQLGKPGRDHEMTKYTATTKKEGMAKSVGMEIQQE